MVPKLLDVYRRISERDVVWYQNQHWACTKVNDCSAKIVPLGSADMASVKINDTASGARISPGVFVGHHKGVSAFNPKDTSVLWLVGQIGKNQIVTTQSHINKSGSRTRVILGIIEVPLLGSAPKTSKRRRTTAQSADVETAESGPAFEPTLAPASLGPKMSWLTALEKAAEYVAAIGLQGAH